MELRVADNPEAGRYEVFAGGDLAGFLTYRRSPGRIALRHTEVDDAFEGHGVGSTLVATVLDEARAAGVEVLPFCPFVKAYIGKHPEHLDLVPAGERDRFEL